MKQQSQKTKDAINAQTGFLQIDKKNFLNIATKYNWTTAGVYSYLIMCRNGTTGACYPSYNTIADSIGINKCTVIKAVKNLTEGGYLGYKQGGNAVDANGNKKNYANSYIFPKEKFIDYFTENSDA